MRLPALARACPGVLPDLLCAGEPVLGPSDDQDRGIFCNESKNRRFEKRMIE